MYNLQIVACSPLCFLQKRKSISKKTWRELSWLLLLEPEGITSKQVILFLECENSAYLWRTWGMEARKHVNTTSHFLQFKGLINCSRKKAYIWYIVWFAAVWSIWQNKNFGLRWVDHVHWLTYCHLYSYLCLKITPISRSSY